MTAAELRAHGFDLLAKGYAALAAAERADERKATRLPDTGKGEWMSTATLLRELDVSARTLDRWRRRNDTDNPFPSPRLTPGGQNRYLRAEVDAWNERRKPVTLSPGPQGP